MYWRIRDEIKKKWIWDNRAKCLHLSPDFSTKIRWRSWHLFVDNSLALEMIKSIGTCDWLVFPVAQVYSVRLAFKRSITLKVCSWSKRWILPVNLLIKILLAWEELHHAVRQWHTKYTTVTLKCGVLNRSVFIPLSLTQRSVHFTSWTEGRNAQNTNSNWKKLQYETNTARDECKCMVMLVAH